MRVLQHPLLYQPIFLLILLSPCKCHWSGRDDRDHRERLRLGGECHWCRAHRDGVVAAREGQEARVMGLPGGQGDGMDGLEGRMVTHAALTHHQLVGVGLLRVELLGRLLPRLGGNQDLWMEGNLSLTNSCLY